MPTKFEIDPDAPILVDFTMPGVQPVAIMRGEAQMDELAKKSQKAIDHAMSTIQNMASKVVAAIKELPKSELPDKVEVEFGLKLDAEAGAMIAKAGAEASIVVTLAWERPEKPVAVLPPTSHGVEH